MSENIKVSLSNFDRSLNVINTYNTYKDRKISEQILVQQKKNNKHLAEMKSQMMIANETNKRILQNQIRQEEQKEEQRFYKSLSYNSNELVELLTKIEDEVVLNYIVNGNYERIKNSLNTSNEILDEINDKLFCRVTLEKLNSIKLKAEETQENYSTDILSKLDGLLLDLRQKEDDLVNVERIEYKKVEFNDKWKINPLRIVGIILLGIATFFMFFSLIISLIQMEISLLVFSTIFLLLLGLPLYLLFKKEIKWRKEFKFYKVSQNKKRELEEDRVKEFELLYNEEIKKHEEIIMNHPSYLAIQEINLKHPTFEIYTNAISDIEMSFMKKWNISTENRERISDIIINFIKKGELINAIVAYKKEYKVNLNIARNNVERIAKNYRY